MNILPLGPAWATNTVNTVIFRHHAILTRGRYQFAAFYESPQTLTIVRRNLADDTLARASIAGAFNLRDAHNSISLGIDRRDCLHLSYDHHAGPLRYRRALEPFAIDAWTEELPMTGEHESVVTYPSFLVSPGHRRLLLLYRSGVHDRGEARLKSYEERSCAWTDFPKPILSGAQQSPWTSNAYWNHPAVGDDGQLHLSFVWRTQSTPGEGRINNIDVDYAWSPDWGRNWLSSRGRPFRLPITQVNSETILPVSPGSNLINQSSMALDPQGRPHIVFYADDPDGAPQYQHLWFDGREWRRGYVSKRKKPFVLAGGGTLQIPISRPEIVIDDSGSAYVIYRGDLTRNRMVARRLDPPHYNPAKGRTIVLWDEPLGFAEPIIDRLRWRNERVLSMLIQKNDQPPGDAAAAAVFEPLFIADFRLPGATG